MSNDTDTDVDGYNESDFDVPELLSGEFSDPNVINGCWFDHSTAQELSEPWFLFESKYLLIRRYCNRFREALVKINEDEIEDGLGMLMDSDGEQCWFVEPKYRVTYETTKVVRSIHFEDWRWDITLSDYFSSVTGAQGWATTAGTSLVAGRSGVIAAQSTLRAAALSQESTLVARQAAAMLEGGNRMSGFLSLEAQSLAAQANRARQLSRAAGATAGVLTAAELGFMGGTYASLHMHGGSDRVGKQKLNTGWELAGTQIMAKKEVARTVFWVPVSEKFDCPTSYWRTWEGIERPEGAGQWYPPEEVEARLSQYAFAELLEYDGPEFVDGFAGDISYLKQMALATDVVANKRVDEIEGISKTNSQLLAQKGIVKLIHLANINVAALVIKGVSNERLGQWRAMAELLIEFPVLDANDAELLVKGIGVVGKNHFVQIMPTLSDSLLNESTRRVKLPKHYNFQRIHQLVESQAAIHQSGRCEACESSSCVGDSNCKEIHQPDCAKVNSIASKDKIAFASQQQALELGFSYCSSCYSSELRG